MNGDKNEHKMSKAEEPDTKELAALIMEKSTVGHNAKNTMEYAVERIVGLTEKNGKLHFIVRWYGYKSTDNTGLPPEDLPSHLVTRYWRRIRQLPLTAQTSQSKFCLANYWHVN